jgi:hypothetical protein
MIETSLSWQVVRTARIQRNIPTNHLHAFILVVEYVDAARFQAKLQRVVVDASVQQQVYVRFH